MGFLSWLNDLFNPQPEYGIPSVTLTGQHVRSKGERVIADYFTRHGIPYYYEAMATTDDWFIFKSKISRPDFYLPQYNLFVEYWGLVDSPDPRTRDNYIRTMRWKMAQYRKNNIRFISIYPSNLEYLDYNFKRKFSETMGFNLPYNPVVSTCPRCHQQILDMQLHDKWHTQTAR
jgi:hypothetical protein